MAKLFDMNNPVWRFMGKIADMFLLTLAWFVCSVPIITIGASTTALYYVSLKMEEGKEGYLFQTFWETFKKYIKQSTGIWLIVLAVGAFLCGDFYICYQTDFPAAKMMSWIFLVFGVVYLLVVTVLFPLAARLDTGIGKMFFMAFMISLKNFAWVLFMLVSTLCIVAMGIYVMWPLLLISVGAIAWIHSKILVKIIFPKYNWTE